MTDVQDLSLFSGLRKIFDHTPRRRRWQGLGVLLFILIGAFAELLTIGAVLPFLALISNSGAPTHGLASDLIASFGGGPVASIDTVALMFCAVAIGAGVIRVALAWLSQKYVFKVGFDLSVSLYRCMLYQPYKFHVDQNSSRILSSIVKVQNIINDMLVPVIQGIISIVIGTFIVLALLMIDAKVALASGGAFALLYIAISVTSRRRLRMNGKIASDCNTARIRAVQEGLGGIRDVLIDSTQPVYIDTFSKVERRLRNAQAQNALISSAPRFVVESLGMVMIAVIAMILNQRSGGVSGSLPTLGALALGAQRLLPLLQQSYLGWTSVMNNRAAFLDFIELLEQPLPADLATRLSVKRIPLPFVQRVAIQHVSFRYATDGPDVLSNIKIDIPKGSRVGFVGRTGSGKSSLIDVFMGLLEPSEGSIEVDGVALTAINIPNWQAQIAHVPQDIYLSDASIMENVAFGTPPDQVDVDRVIEACRDADIHAFIESLPHGYSTHVGERGAKLSGGQRQRIGIARALYKRAAVLVMDEATSALDDKTESSIVDAVERLGREITVLMIAHRVSTLRRCDLIYRLDAGKVVQVGDYREVIDQGNFAELREP